MRWDCTSPNKEKQAAIYPVDRVVIMIREMVVTVAADRSVSDPHMNDSWINGVEHLLHISVPHRTAIINVSNCFKSP